VKHKYLLLIRDHFILSRNNNFVKSNEIRLVLLIVIINCKLEITGNKKQIIIKL
jgi:hypothetical protein